MQLKLKALRHTTRAQEGLDILETFEKTRGVPTKLTQRKGFLRAKAKALLSVGEVLAASQISTDFCLHYWDFYTFAGNNLHNLTENLPYQERISDLLAEGTPESTTRALGLIEKNIMSVKCKGPQRDFLIEQKLRALLVLGENQTVILLTTHALENCTLPPHIEEKIQSFQDQAFESIGEPVVQPVPKAPASKTPESKTKSPLNFEAIIAAIFDRRVYIDRLQEQIALLPKQDMRGKVLLAYAYKTLNLPDALKKAMYTLDESVPKSLQQLLRDSKDTPKNRITIKSEVGLFCGVKLFSKTKGGSSWTK